MIVKKNILYFANILIFLCFTSYIGSFIISAFFASQEIDIILKVILVGLIVIVIAACYIIGSTAQEWELVQDFYNSGNHIRIWEIISVVCMVIFSICISLVFHGVQFQSEGILSIIFAVLMIPVVYIAGRTVQDMITGLLAAVFCIALPVGAISGSEGFVFHYGEGFLKTCAENIGSIGDGGIFVNVLTRLENITNFSSSFPKLIMCIFFFFSIWSGLFLFVSKKNGGVFLTAFFNLIIILQILFDFSSYFYLLIYPIAALTAAMGISFFVHKWIFDEDLEEGYDNATESSFENFSIIDQENEEKEKRKMAENKKAEEQKKHAKEQEGKENTKQDIEKQNHVILEKQEKERQEQEEKKEAEEENEEIKEKNKDIEEESKKIKEENKEEKKKEENKEIKEEKKEIEENKEKNIISLESESDFDITGTEHVVLVREIDFTEPDHSSVLQEKEHELREEEHIMEEEATMFDDESKRLDEEERMLFEPDWKMEKEDLQTMEEGAIEEKTEIIEETKEEENELFFSSGQQDEEEAAFFEELATSAKETERLREQVLQAEEELTELTKKYQRQKTQLKDLIQLLEQAKERQKRDGEEIAVNKQKVAKLESQVKDLNKDIKEKDVLVEEYREKSLKTEKIRDKFLEIKEQNAVLQKDMEEQKEAFSKELEEQQKEVEKYRLTSEEHRMEAEKYRQSAEENRLRAEQLKEEVKSARLEAETIKAENDRYKDEANSFRRQSEEYHQETIVLSNEIDDLKEQLEIARQDNSKEQLELLKEEKEQLEVRYHSRFEELQKEKSELEKRYQEEVQKRKELLRRAKEEINRVRNQTTKRNLH